MKIEVIKEKGYMAFGAGEYVREGRKKVLKKLPDVEIWKYEGKYYWIEDGKVKKLGN